MVERQEALVGSLALRLRRLHIEDHAVELRRGIGGVVGDDFGHALQRPGRLATPDRRPIGISIRRPDGKAVEVSLTDQVRDVAVLVHSASRAVEGRAVDAEIEICHPARGAALD